MFAFSLFKLPVERSQLQLLQPSGNKLFEVCLGSQIMLYQNKTFLSLTLHYFILRSLRICSC